MLDSGTTTSKRTPLETKKIWMQPGDQQQRGGRATFAGAEHVLELDLEAREEQREDEPDERDDEDRRVDLDEARHGRSDDDPEREQTEGNLTRRCPGRA